MPSILAAQASATSPSSTSAQSNPSAASRATKSGSSKAGAKKGAEDEAETSNSAHSECVAEDGFCVTVPQSWRRLGEVFGGQGLVVAEPQEGQDNSHWPQLTIAVLDARPDEKSGRPAPTLDALMDSVLMPNAAQATIETVHRQRLMTHGASAQMVTVRLHGPDGRVDAVEDVALIDAGNGLIDSVALRCAPQDFARLEPIFIRVVHNWRRQPAAPRRPSEPASTSAPLAPAVPAAPATPDEATPEP